MINNYDYKISSFFQKFFNLLLKKYKSFDAPANFFIFYQYIAFYSLLKKYENSNDKWIFIKNEDLNLNFLETIKNSVKININFCQDWDSSNYKIKMMGKEWNGTRAYNSNYNPNKSKILSNELKSRVKIIHHQINMLQKDGNICCHGLRNYFLQIFLY